MYGKIIGLTSSEVLASREKHGANALKREKSKGFFRRFFDNLNDPIIKVLIVALIIQVVFTLGNTNYFEVLGILMAILIAATVSTVSELGSERAFKRMQSEELLGAVRVLRDGAVRTVSATELVVGDIVYLSQGEQIFADGIIISGKISVDQSALNGESREVTKEYIRGEDASDLSSRSGVFRGSLISCGEAIMRVSAVGADTYYGLVAKDVQAQTRVSPLKLRLGRLAGQISRIGYVLAAVVALAYLFNSIVVDNGFSAERIVRFVSDYKGLFSVLLHALTLMITVIVVAVPEGLPMMITVVLSANMKKMLRDGVLVKKLVGIETAGSLNILFTDKTGTVTTGEPQCERILTTDGVYGSATALRKNKILHTYMTMSALLNTDVNEEGRELRGGNGTDRAIYDFFRSEARGRWQISAKEPFSSEKKISSVTLLDGAKLIKGAPEILISKCPYMLSIDGVQPINRGVLEGRLYEATSRGKRVVAVCVLDKSLADGAVFLGLIVLCDLLRRDSKDAIKGIQSAGVRIVMLTGDGKETAAAVARECGIIRRESDRVITSAELSKMTDGEVKELLPHLSVLARALPQDKTRLVRLAQEMELVVGMTGDGINDAPALKLADVGFAMGSGTEIAKGAGDIVIQNNSLYSINRTILYGRTIFKSIRKFISFQLVMNIAASGISLIGQLFGIDSPITIIQMLWVNIIMDTLGGLAFAGEGALEYYMKEKPKRRDEPILSSEMIGAVFIRGAYTLGICMLFLLLPYFRAGFVGEGGALRHLTAFYALFIFLGIFNCFIARSERLSILSGIGKNKPFVIIMLLISVIQIIMIYCGGELFRSSPLTPAELFRVILLAFTVIPFDMIRRVMIRLK